MTDLPPATPFTATARVHPDDVRATLQGIDPGWYRAVDLAPRYNEVARRAGRDPGSVKDLGQRLRREFPGIETRPVHNHLNVYRVTEEMTCG